jgi:hypothetical protein
VTRKPTPAIALAVLILAAGACRAPRPEASSLGAPEAVAAGVEFYRTNDASLVAGGGAVSIYLLRLDPARITIRSALSNGEVMDAEPVDRIARQAGAIAAVNGGFFNEANGEPLGVLKVAGELVSDAGTSRGAVIIEHDAGGRTHLEFDRVSARISLRFAAAGADQTVDIAGVDTTRERGKLMLFTPAYHPDTDTAPTGTEWVVDGTPPRVVAVRSAAGHTPIPRHGGVLSYGGVELPDELAGLVVGTPVSFDTHWRSASGLPPERLDQASDIIGGAGLLRRDGERITEWRTEGLAPDVFLNVRHPRTLIGRDRRGFIWLGVVDGRQADHSLGMTFDDLQRLCDRLELTDALNLDGGGSSTMVVRGSIVNRPSDLIGPRPVSDAILVEERAGAGH